MELSNTAYVILGALQERPRSGYDIKSFADKSVRQFWAVSYGQLYPELKHLIESGLIEAESSPTGSRKRTIYRVTPRGLEALADWVEDLTERPMEIRDEMLVRLYFSDVAPRESRIALARAMAERHRGWAVWLEGHRHTDPATPENPMHEEIWRMGVLHSRWLAAWLDDLAQRLEEAEER